MYSLYIENSVQFSRSVVSDSLRPNESQHARPPCPSPTPGVHSNSHPSSRWCHPAISSSIVPFSSCPQSLPASESFPVSQLFAWGGQNTGISALASFLPKNTQGRSSIQSAKIRPGADCGSDHELLIAKCRLKLKKVGKTTRPFRDDLNQIPYDYTVEVRNRFKGLDLIDRWHDELWNEVRDIVQETGIKTIPMEKKCKRQNDWGGLKNSCEEKWKAKEQRKDISIWMQSSKE